MIWALIALGLVLVLTAVWALGGFAVRGDQIARVDAGTTLVVGPYELTFSSASVQHLPSEEKYEVVVAGTGRTTKDKTISPPTGEASFVYTKNPANQETQTVQSFDYGDSTDVILQPDSFTPGLDKIAFSATFDYAQPVSGELTLIVFDQEFSDNYIFSDDEPTWNRIDSGYAMTLPVRTLPDRTY